MCRSLNRKSTGKTRKDSAEDCSFGFVVRSLQKHAFKTGIPRRNRIQAAIQFCVEELRNRPTYDYRTDVNVPPNKYGISDFGKFTYVHGRLRVLVLVARPIAEWT